MFAAAFTGTKTVTPLRRTTLIPERIWGISRVGSAVTVCASNSARSSVFFITERSFLSRAQCAVRLGFSLLGHNQSPIFRKRTSTTPSAFVKAQCVQKSPKKNDRGIPARPPHHDLGRDKRQDLTP